MRKNSQGKESSKHLTSDRMCEKVSFLISDEFYKLAKEHAILEIESPFVREESKNYLILFLEDFSCRLKLKARILLYSL